MKKILPFALALLFISTMTAQDKQYTMTDAVLGLRQDLRSETIRQTTWIPDSNHFTKLTDTDTDPTLTAVSVPKMKASALFSLSEINAQLKTDQALNSMPQMKWLSANEVYFKSGDTFYTGQLSQDAWTFKKWVELPKNTSNLYVNKAERQIAYTRDNNLYYANTDGTIKAITKNDNPDIISGQVVSRFEFGVNRGVFFSPNNNLIAFYQKDVSDVHDYPIINWEPVPATVKMIKYPMAGTPSEHVTMGVYNPKTGKTVFMQTGKNTEHYLTNVTWGPKGEYLYIAILQRDQEHLALNKYDVNTGELVETLLKESDDKYLHPAQPLYFIPGKDNQFIWWSLRDGFMHLYRYKTNGKLLNQITSGDWLVNSIEGWIPKNNEVIITATKLSAMDRTAYAVNWKNGTIRRLDEAKGMHNIEVNTDGTYLIDQYNNYNTPNAIRIAATSSDWDEMILKADNPLTAYAKPEIKELTITAADGKTPLNARLILPPNFDASKKYPVVVYLYNGPGVQLLHHRFPETGNLWYNYMAQHGYIIFTMDGRGSSNRGLAFEQVTYRDLGTTEMKDQLQGVKYLKSLPYVDADRLGVHGWSFGGFMTTSLMLRHPGVFKVGVAGGPVIDWSMYEIMYTERYMDTPQENPEGYAKSSLLDKVDNLEGKLLLIHGAQDSTVVWQNSMKFLHQCIQHNVQVDYFVYPAHPHNVRGENRVHLMRKVTDYFDEFLK